MTPTSATPSDGLILRQFRPGDETAVVAILEDTFHSTWAPQLRPAALERRLSAQPARAYVAEKGRQFVVAVQDGAIVGMIHWDGDFIHALHVPRSAQRRGVGRALLARAEAAIASDHGAARLETDTFNQNARAFYAGCGYREIDSYPDEEWDSGLTTLLLEKTLRGGGPQTPHR